MIKKINKIPSSISIFFFFFSFFQWKVIFFYLRWAKKNSTFSPFKNKFSLHFRWMEWERWKTQNLIFIQWLVYAKHFFLEKEKNKMDQVMNGKIFQFRTHHHDRKTSSTREKKKLILSRNIFISIEQTMRERLLIKIEREWRKKVKKKAKHHWWMC